jgi:hypothetical protein
MGRKVKIKQETDTKYGGADRRIFLRPKESESHMPENLTGLPDCPGERLPSGDENPVPAKVEWLP